MSQSGRSFTNSGPGGFVQTLTGNTGGAITPSAGNINVVGDGTTVTVAGNLATHTLTISTTGIMADSFPTDSGTATPAAGVLNIFSGATSLYDNINTAGAGNTVSVKLNDYIRLPVTNAALTAGNIQIGGNRFLHAYGTDNTFLGQNAGNTSLTGNENSGGGKNSLNGLTSGSQNSAWGSTSAPILSTANNCNAFGYQSLLNNTSGSSNCAFGSASLAGVSTSNGNSAFGHATLQLGNGSNNCAFGYQAANATSGSSNVAMGYNSSGSALNTASNFTTIGANSAESNQTGAELTAVGFQSLQSNTTADYNTSLGSRSMRFVTTSRANTACGIISLGALLTGTGENTAVGYHAGGNITTGAYNTFVGMEAGSSLGAAESGNIFIGAYATGVLGENQTIRIGSTGGNPYNQTTCYIAGIAGNTVSNTALVTINTSTGQLGSTDLSPFPWSVITIDQTAAINNGYFVNKAGTLSLGLPAASSVGDVIEVANINTALGVLIIQGVGQQIRFGNNTTTLGAGGSLASIALGDALKMVCSVANTTWVVVSSVGNWTIV